MVLSTALLGWGIRRTETSFADGLRYIHQAERIEDGSWRAGALQGGDHPVHSLLIAAVHRVTGGDGPASWQQAALWLSFSCTVLLVLPTYLLGLELFGARAAWLAGLLVPVNPLSSYIVVNVLSESTFLVPWTFGLWAGIRFLRAGHVGWLVMAIASGGAAYLTRPEGLLLSVGLLATLLLSAVFRATRLDWQRWWRLVAFVVAGMVVLTGPFVAVRGGVGTKPGIARVLGLAPRSSPRALERERPLPSDQAVLETYRIAFVRMLKVLRAAVTLPLLPFALVGLLVMVRRETCARAALFVALVLAASAVALVRLHATGGYCTTRHGLVPGALLSVIAAGGLCVLTDRIKIPGRWIGAGRARVGLPSSICSVVIAVLMLSSGSRGVEFLTFGPFGVYHDTAGWLNRNVGPRDKILDMTDWSIYLSRRAGYHFADVYKAPADPETRWIVVREPHVEGRWPYSHVLRDLIGDRSPSAVIPAVAAPGQLQIWIYDRQHVEYAPGITTSPAISAYNQERLMNGRVSTR